MKKSILLLLAAGVFVVTGCPRTSGQAAGEAQPAGTVAVDEPETAPDVTAAAEGFSFDELFRIFSIFGDNIMTAKFAPQSVKDRIKPELKESYDGAVEFVGPTNHLEYSLFDGDCYDGFVPFNPAPERDDFEDLVRLAGADVEELRGVMQAGLYDYEWRTDGALVRLNDPMDFDEHVYHGALFVDYLWNGSELVRNEDYVYPCIHAEGFGSILLGQGVPDLRFDYDPVGYDVKYSEGGDLWLVELDGKDVLQIQMEFDQVQSIEVFSPKYCVAKTAYENDGMQQPRVGGRIGDCLAFGEEAPQVWMLMDGTVQIEDDIWNSRIAFRTARESLVNPPQPSANGRIRIENPKFKPSATIGSILLWRE